MTVQESESVKALIRATVPRSVRNWPRSPSSSAQWLWDSTCFFLGTTKTLQLTTDWAIVCHPLAYKPAYQGQVGDADQRAEFHSFLTSCSNKMFLFDIGAHFGVFSLAAAHFGGKAIAVDPSPAAERMIAIQAALNGCTNSIQILRAAVSDANGVIGMLSAGVFTYGFCKVAAGRSKHELTKTPSITIDQMVRQFGAPTHIKIDVEGHEAAVLRGAKYALRQFSPVLFLELHNEMVRFEGGDPNAALDELAEAGYSSFALNGDAIDRRAILEKPIIRVVARSVGR